MLNNFGLVTFVLFCLLRTVIERASTIKAFLELSLILCDNYNVTYMSDLCECVCTGACVYCVSVWIDIGIFRTSLSVNV